MDMKPIYETLTWVQPYVVALLVLVSIVFLVLLVRTRSRMTKLQASYTAMMTGAEGKSLEEALKGHVEEVQTAVERCARVEEESKRLDALLQKALTRIGIVRFSAFADVGSDLSYAVALLDSHDNGVVLSGIFAREDSRTYVKPITGGTSSYALTKEEQEALQKAKNSIE